MGICLGNSRRERSGSNELKAELSSSAHDSGNACSRIPAVRNDAWSITPNISSVLMTGACARQDKYSVHTICKKIKTQISSEYMAKRYESQTKCTFGIDSVTVS